MTRRFIVCLLLVACSGPAADAPEGQATEPASEPAEPAEPAAGEPAPEPAQSTVDLLHAVTTDIAVSTVYRGRGDRVPQIADGEMATAWCSESGDLVGAWIEIRIPANATVTSMAMTAGFAQPPSDADLFDGNHRIARVRVARRRGDR